MSNEYSFRSRLVLQGSVTIEADSAEEAQRKFDAGDFHCLSEDMQAMELADFQSFGEPKLTYED